MVVGVVEVWQGRCGSRRRLRVVRYGATVVVVVAAEISARSNLLAPLYVFIARFFFCSFGLKTAIRSESNFVCKANI